MSRVCQKWLGFTPTENQLQALEKRYHTVNALEDALCRMVMSYSDRNERYFRAWLEQYK